MISIVPTDLSGNTLPVWVHDHMSTRAAKNSKLFMISQRRTLVGAGFFRILLSNPANSGKRCVILGFITFSSLDVPGTADVYDQPTTGLPELVEETYAVRWGSTLTQGVLVAGADTSLTTPLGGGTHTYQFPFAPGRGITPIEPTWSLGEVILEPGKLFGLNVLFAAAVDTDLGTLVVEEPI